MLALLPGLLLAEGTALADPTSLGPGLRPFVHTNKYGQTLVDVCPERTPGGRRCYAQRILAPGEKARVPYGGGGSCSGSGGSGGVAPPKGALTPSDLLSHYNIPSTASANGAIVALVDLTSTNAMTDVNTYRTQFGIPPLPACPVNASGVPTPGGVACFARVGTDGTVNSLSTTDCPGWAGETALDMEMVSAVCPDCSIVVIEALDAFGTDLDQMNPIAAYIGAAAVSNSWGAPETGGDDQSFYMSPGLAILAASGDDGYLMEDIGAGTPSFPASSPLVLAVGGTSLTITGEQVWDDDASGGGGSTTSGCSTEFPMPTYQSTAPFHFGKCTMRAVADVSAVADFHAGGGQGGIAVYLTDDHGWEPFIGTSASSPIVAGILVRLGLAGTDNHALFYQNGGAFNDITLGNDDPAGICTDKQMCTAEKDWDGPTGIGTPDGTLLLALAGGTLEPDPDAGPIDAGMPDTGAMGDGGMDAPADTSPPPMDATMDTAPPPPSKGTGAPCAMTTQCEEPDFCVAPAAGKQKVCAPSCTGTGASDCPAHTTCQGGYCFAAPPKKMSDATPSNGGSGCSCSTAGGGSAGPAAFALLALIPVGIRRKRRRPTRSSR